MNSSMPGRGVLFYSLLLAGAGFYSLFQAAALPDISYLPFTIFSFSGALALHLDRGGSTRRRIQRGLLVGLGLTGVFLCLLQWLGQYAEVLIQGGFYAAWMLALLRIHPGMSVRERRYIQVFVYVLAIAVLLGAAVNFLDLGLVFGQPLLNPWAISTVLSLTIFASVLFLCLHKVRRSDDSGDGDHKARRINTVGIVNLILIAFITGLASFAVLKTQVEKALSQRLRLTMVYRSLTLHNTMQSAYQDVIPLTYNRELAELLRRLGAEPANEELQRGALQRVDDIVPFAVEQMRFLDEGGRVLAARGDPQQGQPLWTDYRDRAEIRLLWHDGRPALDLQLRLRGADGLSLGSLVITVPSPALEQLLSDNFDLGDSGEMLVCGMQDLDVQCMQSRDHTRLYRPDAGHEFGQWMLDSLEAESASPVLTRDGRGRQVMLAYGPVGPYGMVLRVPPKGLAILIKMDATELYAPIRRQLLYVLPVLALIILVGGVLLRHLVRPLVRALRSEEARFRELTVLSSDGYWAMNADLRFTELRGDALAEYGIRVYEWIGCRLEETPAIFEFASAQQQLDEAMNNRNVFHEITLCVPLGEGRLAYLDFSGTPQYDEDGRFTGYRGVAKDVTLRKMAENSSIEAQATLERRVEERTAELEATIRFLAREIDERRQAEERFRSLTELSSDWYWEQDAEFRFTQIAGEVHRKGGFSAHESVGRCLWELDWANDRSNDWDGLRHKLETGHDFHDFTFKARDFSGKEHYVSISGHPVFKDGVLVGYRGIGKDVSDKQRSEEHVRFLAHYDALTQLPNRVLLGEHVRLALERARRSEGRVALLFVDLDRFKIINDTLGHEAGDKVLLEVAQRLTRCVRDSDLVARLGGDEFVILLDNVHDGAHVRFTARRMLEGVREPITLAGENYQVGASIGVSIFPEDGDNLSDLLKNADAAMYLAKESGRNGIFFYSDTVNELALYGSRMDGDLALAVDKGQLLLHYQAQLDLRDKRIVGVEALLRWRHPQHGLLSPSAFLPAAEESGLIVPIGDWVLREALTALAGWDAAGLPPLTLSVNLSPWQLCGDFVARAQALLGAAGVAPQRLVLEIPENQVSNRSVQEIAMLETLRAQGIRVALDNFGAGRSACPLPVDQLKIDRSHVDGIPNVLNKVAVVRAALRLGADSGMQVLAEGVETQAQYQWLLDEGCSAIQGFFFSHPMPADSLADLVQQQERRRADGGGGGAA